MNIKNPFRMASARAVLILLAAATALAAEKEKTESRPAGGQALFSDDILCKGQGIEVRRSQVDEAYMQFRANVVVRGQTVPEEKRAMYEAQMLDRIVLSRLLVNRATADDKKKAREAADKFIAETRKQAGSEASFQRQLTAMAFSTEQFDAQILERAICEEVVDRELRSKVNIPEDQARKYYEENKKEFARPEMVRASHILLTTRDSITGLEFNEEKRKEKKQRMEGIWERARKGEDFAALVKEFSEDPGSKERGGEYLFARARDDARNAMVPEFENAAFSLKTNEVSGIVTTQFGYHIIKLNERIPAHTLEFAKVEQELKDYLARQEVQEKRLPEFLKQLKQEARLEYFNGAKPPEAFESLSTGKAAPEPEKK